MKNNLDTLYPLLCGLNAVFVIALYSVTGFTFTVLLMMSLGAVFVWRWRNDFHL